MLLSMFVKRGAVRIWLCLIAGDGGIIPGDGAERRGSDGGSVEGSNFEDFMIVEDSSDSEGEESSEVSSMRHMCMYVYVSVYVHVR